MPASSAPIRSSFEPVPWRKEGVNREPAYCIQSFSPTAWKTPIRLHRWVVLGRLMHFVRKAIARRSPFLYPFSDSKHGWNCAQPRLSDFRGQADGRRQRAAKK